MKAPFVTHEKLEEIIARYNTPFYLYDEKGIRENARRVNESFAWNKGFKEYFAVKATPNPVILKILRDEGCGVDCSGMTELMMAEAVGFCGAEIMFSSNATPAEEFIYAKKLGAIINLDDFTHIDFLDTRAGIPATICLRYNPGGSFVISNKIMDVPGEAKYGFTKRQLLEGFIKLRDMGVKEFGLHAFLASNTLTNAYYPALARLLFETAVWLKAETDIPVSFINLSGGIGIPYKPEDKPNDINVIAKMVRDVYDETLAANGLGNVAIFSELGRFMLGPYGCLVATAAHKKEIYKNYIGLDACAANLLRPAMYGAYHHITVSGKENLPCDHMYDITGSLCENNDKFAINRKLPKIETGDRIVIHDAGAHGFAMGYNYNGKLKSAELLLRLDGDVELIRRAETPADYFATLNATGYDFEKKKSARLRFIDAAQITATVAELCAKANFEISEDIRTALNGALAVETSPLARTVLDTLLENASVAAREKLPICQDTGMAVVFISIGLDIHVNGDINEAINEGVRRGYAECYFRSSVARDPINRVNTGDNTPAVIYYDFEPGDKLRITVAPKGFGSENMSKVCMLNPSDGLDGVEDFILETVRSAGANPCPPVIVGVGIGGTMDKAALLSKQALTREVGSVNADPFWAEVEARLLVRINELGIGPAGFGGKTTTLGAHILTYPTHIAGLPVAVNIGCHATRHRTAVI